MLELPIYPICRRADNRWSRRVLDRYHVWKTIWDTPRQVGLLTLGGQLAGWRKPISISGRIMAGSRKNVFKWMAREGSGWSIGQDGKSRGGQVFWPMASQSVVYPNPGGHLWVLRNTRAKLLLKFTTSFAVKEIIVKKAAVRVKFPISTAQVQALSN